MESRYFLKKSSHELRTALNAIIGFSQFLIDERVAKKDVLYKYASIIHENNFILQIIIHEILMLAKVKSGKTRKHVVFDEIVSDLKRIERKVFDVIKDKPNLYFVQEQPFESVKLEYDKQFSPYIYEELIHNAIKFCPKGEIRAGMFFEDSTQIVYCYNDTQEVYSKEECAHFFQKFYQKDSFSAGLGLGLTVCKAIADSYDGYIGVFQEKGRILFWSQRQTTFKTKILDSELYQQMKQQLSKRWDGFYFEKKSLRLNEEKENKVQRPNFLVNMSHEILTPINSIVGFSELIIEDPEDEMVKLYSDIINENTDLLLSLLDNLLLSNFSAIHLYTSKITFDTIKYLTNKKFFFDKQIQEKKKDLKILIDHPYKKGTLLCYKNCLTQVVNNYLSNAIKYSNKGTIRVGLIHYNQNQSLFYVADEGIGLPLDDLDKLFMSGEKLDNITNGNGLGLAICREIADTVKTSYGAVNRKDTKGSIFWVVVNEKFDYEIDESKQEEWQEIDVILQQIYSELDLF